MNNINNTILIEKVMNSVKIRGYKKTLDLLSFEDDFKPILKTKNDKIIISQTIKLFEITNNDLFFSRYDSREELKYAIGICVYFFYKYRTLGDINKNIFKMKNKGLLSRYRQMIIDLDATSKYDMKYIKIKNTINKAIVINDKTKINE
jgi:hypothetical protein